VCTSAGCRSTLDVALLLDLSGSVEAEYDLIMDFSRALTLGLSINNDAVRVGVVPFSDNVSRVIYLNQFIGRQHDLVEVFNFAHHRGRTNIQVSPCFTLSLQMSICRATQSNVSNALR